MKLVSATTVAALVLGARAIMHSSTAHAMLPLSTCIQLNTECQQGNQQACQTFALGCKAKAPLGSILIGTPLTKNVLKSNDAS